MSTLQNAVLRAITYYDIFDYPLHDSEVWRWLETTDRNAPSFTSATVHEAIEALLKERKLERHGAYVVLPGRQAIVDIRTTRMMANVKLWNRAASTARFLELVPFIRMVAVVNSLATDNARPESDIDLFIVIAPNHIWITRAIVTFIVSLLGYRRHGTKIAGRICLSFYITTDALNMEPLKCSDEDTYLRYWTAQIVPLIDEGTYERWRQANSWVTKRLPNAWQWDWKGRLLTPNPGLLAIKRFYELFFSMPMGHWVEALIRDRQLKRMEADTKSKANRGTTDVVISEDVLKFHEADRRREYNERYQIRLREQGLIP